jgi:cation-transporting ATPase 13A3/4/5
MYALIAFSSATLLYKIAQNLADYQWLYIDLVLLIPLSIFMGDT